MKDVCNKVQLRKILTHNVRRLVWMTTMSSSNDLLSMTERQQFHKHNWTQNKSRK